MTDAAPAKGKNDLDTVVLTHPSGASAEVYLWGATLASYKSPSGKENIFVSPGAKFDEKAAIRGGVPVVFPQFGRPIESMPQHGFARISKWSIAELKGTAVEAVAVFSTADSEFSLAQWPHKFALLYEVSLTADRLKMTLQVTNTDEKPWSFQALLHSYFSVSDVAEVGVEGLKGLRYDDKTTGGDPKDEAREQVVVEGYTDSVYLNTDPAPKEVTIVAKGGEPLYKLSHTAKLSGAERPCDIVVWNPHEEKSPGDLPVPAYQNFVCVEPGLVGQAHELQPGATAEVSQSIFPVA
mmetsp:Transcript_97883/g.272350  ORF Transcript_97883/g.272350 Transcript_97883/m.272350 type:complete len:295 (-) Transcript_97883:111-995(-)